MANRQSISNFKAIDIVGTHLFYPTRIDRYEESPS